MNKTAVGMPVMIMVVMKMREASIQVFPAIRNAVP
jgi:hypothetical protein